MTMLNESVVRSDLILALYRLIQALEIYHHHAPPNQTIKLVWKTWRTYAYRTSEMYWCSAAFNSEQIKIKKAKKVPTK